MMRSKGDILSLSAFVGLAAIYGGGAAAQYNSVSSSRAQSAYRLHGCRAS